MLGVVKLGKVWLLFYYMCIVCFSLLPEMKELSVMNNYLGVGLDAKIAYKFNETREKNPNSYK